MVSMLFPFSILTPPSVWGIYLNIKYSGKKLVKLRGQVIIW
jgi:hypothetical protein